ncbi:MAG: dockerin type I domain-containing protein [Planctomycetota bacterium]|jgi:hypothetical protein
MTHRIDRRRATGSLVAVATVALALAGPSEAHEKYSPGCTKCHGDFDGPVSPKGTIFPGDDKHQMHRSSSWMGADCQLCHTSVGDNPFIGMSAGTAANPGVGCTGCHGRDYGGTLGNSGVGLRRHHLEAGVTECQQCHPNDPDPLPENIAPIYYGTSDTNVDDACNGGPDFLENWSIGDTVGLDNDGDLLYDADDPDCSGTCTGDVNIDGVVDVQDLVEVILQWGSPGGPADVNGDGIVDVQDLVEVILAWGTC